MLAEDARGLGKRQLLRIVAGQAQAIPGWQARHGNAPARPESSSQIAARSGSTAGSGATAACGRVVLRQRFLAPMASQPIDIPLREDGSQPGDQAAAAVEVAEERLAFAASLAQPEELAVQRIGKIARAATGIERIGRAVQQRPMLQNKVVPCALVAVGACARQREVFQVQAVRYCSRLRDARCGPRARCALVSSASAKRSFTTCQRSALARTYKRSTSLASICTRERFPQYIEHQIGAPWKAKALVAIRKWLAIAGPMVTSALIPRDKLPPLHDDCHVHRAGRPVFDGPALRGFEQSRPSPLPCRVGCTVSMPR